MPARIVTLTLNPAIDVSTSVAAVVPTDKLRCRAPRYDPGGGGLNVARVALRLGATAVAVAPLGGDNGARLQQLMEAEGVSMVAVPVQEATRHSFSVSDERSGDQYRFVLPGAALAPDVGRRCAQAVAEVAAGAACVVISGSVPGVDMPSGTSRGWARELFAGIVETVAPVPVLIDTSGPALEAARRAGAQLIKPSARELSALVGRELLTEAEILDGAREVLGSSDLAALVVSIGPGGAFLVRRNGEAVRLRAPTVRVRSAIGAGDSMVAGIAVGLSRGADLLEAVRFGVATGTAAVLTDGTQLSHPSDVDRLLPLVHVHS